MTAVHRTCAFCVMDDSNPAIRFDANGQCNCCRDAIARMPSEWWPDLNGEIRMNQLVADLKTRGRGKQYDAMVGLSGGIDSAYLAHLASKKHDLRLLAVHVDGGWNSEPAVHNIESMVRGLGIDFHTYVVEWQEMRDIQVAFLKASVLNQDIPQDHAFFATLYRTAKKFGIRDFLSGVNFASECVVPPGFGYPSMDGKHARAIHKIFGAAPLETYPIMEWAEYLWLTRVRRQLTIHRPLNFLNYDKETARLELEQLYGWRDYGGKHSESRFTKFYQEIYLPQKFGFDKRRLHLSSLIVSGQIRREYALEELATPITSARQTRRDIKFVAKKLNVAQDQLQTYIDAAPINHRAYPNGLKVHAWLSRLKRFLRPSAT